MNTISTKGIKSMISKLYMVLIVVVGVLGIAHPHTAFAAPIGKLPAQFEALPDDPINYMIPKAADRFAQGDTYKIPEPTPGGQGAGAIVPGLEKFYNQKVVWGKCDDFDPATPGGYKNTNRQASTACAYVILPMDYTNPNGQTIAIALMSIYTGQGEPQGTILMNPGGPGVSGTQSVYSLSETQRPDQIVRKFRIVGFDPRGVGSSLPAVRCMSSAAFDLQRRINEGLDAGAQNAITKYGVDSCYRNTGRAFGIDGHEFIANVGSINVVRDMDILRSVLGLEKLNFLGLSYGTQLGIHYAQMFPNNMRAFVLDGAVNPFLNNPDELAKYKQYIPQGIDTTNVAEEQAVGFQQNFEKFLSTCISKGGFEFEGKMYPCAVGPVPDAKAGVKVYSSIAQKAWGGNYYTFKDKTGTERGLSFRDINQAVVYSLYSVDDWPRLNYALYKLAGGDPRETLKIADETYSRGSDGRYGLEECAFNTIWCIDNFQGKQDADSTSAQDAETLKARLKIFKETAPMLDPGVDENGKQRGMEASCTSCDFYDVKEVMPKFHSMAASSNVLVVSTTNDPSTPYHNGVVMAAAMRAHLLTVAGFSHTALAESPSAEQIIISFFATQTPDRSITGKMGIETKDIYSNTIMGNECTLYSFADPQ